MAIRDKKPQKRKKTSVPERYGLIEDVRFGALIALGVAGYPHAVMFDPDTNPALVKFIRSFGTIEQDGALHSVEWLAHWTAISDNEATLIEVARIGQTPDYRLADRDTRHKWFVQAIQIMADYGIADVPTMANVLAFTLNCDMNDHMRRSETLQDATYRLHHQCSQRNEARRTHAEQKLAAHAPAGREHSDDITDWFPQKDKPMSQYPDWIDKPDAAQFAIPNHIKRELLLEASEVGWHVRQCYDMPITVFLTQHGARAAYDRCVQYCKLILSQREENHAVDAHIAQQEQAESDRLDRIEEDREIQDYVNEHGDVPPDHPLRVKESEMQFPESPVVVFPQGNGSVNYKGIKFSVTLRIGGTFAQAVPLMDEYVTALAMEIIELDRSCLVSQPAQQQSRPAQPVVQQTAQPTAAPAQTANGNGQKYENVNRVACDSVNGVNTYSLWSSNAALQWPLWKLESGKPVHAEHLNQLLAALNAHGIQNLAGGTSANVNLKVYWTPSEKLNKNNQPYKNIAQIVAEQPEPANIPF
jgi:hypothetical protein